MRFKYLILLVSCLVLIAENALGEIAVKNIFSIPGQINIKTGDVGKATTRDKIKQALKERLASVLETKKNRPNEKIEILSALINNVVSALKRSGGYAFVQYGTQLSKATLQDFNEIIESILQVKDPEILITEAILNKTNQATIDPGTKLSGASPEDEPDDAQTPKTVELTLQDWINFLKYYDQQHKDIPGDYYVLNPIKIYNDFVQEQAKTRANEQQKIDVEKATALVDEQKKKDDEAKEEAKIKEEERKAKEDAEAKKKADEDEALKAKIAADKLAQEQAEAKKAEEDEHLKKEKEDAVTEMQALLKQKAAKIAADKLAQEEARKKKESDEEARVKEEERKAKEDAAAKKKADEEATALDEEQKKKDDEAKKKADEEKKKDDEATDTQLDQEPEAKAKEEGSPAKLQHLTKSRSRPTRRPPTIHKKQASPASILDEIVQKINSISIEISIPGVSGAKSTKTSKKIYDLTEHEIIKNQDPISAIKTEISKLVEDLKKSSSTELESMLNKNTSSKQDLDKAFRIIYPEEYKEDGTLKIFFKLMQESVKTEIQKNQDRITNQLKTELDEIAKTTKIEAQIYMLESILSSRDYDNNFLQTKVENKIFENLKKLFDEYATKITSPNLDVGTKLNNLLKNAKDKAFLTPDQKAACVEMYAQMLLETSLINPPSEKEKTEVIKIKNIVSKPDFNKKYLQNYPSITNSIYTHIKEVFKSQTNEADYQKNLPSILTMAKNKEFLNSEQQNFIKILEQIQKIINRKDILVLINAATELNQLVKDNLKEELTNSLPSEKDLNWIQTTLSSQIKGTNGFQNASEYAKLRSFLSVQDIKEQPAEEKTKEAEAAAEELKRKQTHAKSLADEKAEIEKEWDELSQTSSTIESLSAALKDEKFSKEYLNDTQASKLIFESIKNFCQGLDTKTKDNVINLKELLAIAIAKPCFDEATSTALKELGKIVSLWINCLKPIYDAGNTDITYGNPLQTAKIWDAPPTPTAKLEQSNSILKLKNINLIPMLTALNKSENTTLLNKLVSKNFISLDTLKKIRQTLINVCGNEYNKQTYGKLKETIEKLLPTIPPATAPKSTPHAKTGAKRQPAPTPPAKTPFKVVPSAPTESHESPEITLLKQKLTYLKQNLEKLKIKLSQLSQKLGSLKKTLISK
ncbi:MAG: hypothetical protein V1646_01405 [bacterium]